jgi:hypothetical protein
MLGFPQVADQLLEASQGARHSAEKGWSPDGIGPYGADGEGAIMLMREAIESAVRTAGLHVPSEVGLVTASLVLSAAVVIGVLVLYLGIALRAALGASDATDVRYQVFRDLLGIVSKMIDLIGDFLMPFRGGKRG